MDDRSRWRGRLRVWRRRTIVLAWLALLAGNSATAATYTLHDDDSSLIGALQRITAEEGDMLIDLAPRYDLGQDELLLANPDKARWIPIGGQTVLLPTRHVLPQSPRSGVIVNLPERRLYWFVPQRSGSRQQVVTFPVSVGKLDWSTPVTVAQVVSRKENPPWYPPASIREEAAERGIALPDVVPAGPANPLGRHALYLNLPGYLIHGTNNPSAIGLRVTHGCIRLYPEDVEFLYRLLPESTTVTMVDQPVKVGWQGNNLYVEVHPPLEESHMSEDEQLVQAMALVRDAMTVHPDIRLKTWLIRRAVQRRDGIPVSVTSSSMDSSW